MLCVDFAVIATTTFLQCWLKICQYWKQCGKWQTLF